MTAYRGTTNPSPPRSAEAADLRARIAAQRAELERAQAEWDRLAEPIRARIVRATDDHDATGHESYLRDIRKGHLDLRLLGPRPVEPLRLAGLVARLWRTEHRETGR